MPHFDGPGQEYYDEPEHTRGPFWPCYYCFACGMYEKRCPSCGAASCKCGSEPHSNICRSHHD